MIVAPDVSQIILGTGANALAAIGSYLEQRRICVNSALFYKQILTHSAQLTPIIVKAVTEKNLFLQMVDGIFVVSLTYHLNGRKKNKRTVKIINVASCGLHTFVAATYLSLPTAFVCAAVNLFSCYQICQSIAQPDKRRKRQILRNQT